MRGCKLVGILFLALGILTGCGGGGDAFTGGGDPGSGGSPSGDIASQNGATLSHTDDRRGRNCMECHYTGNNPYVYSVAGTVYQLNDFNTVYPDATINFYSGPNGTGTLVGTMEVDANGNFYTTDTMDFSTGVYPAIEGTAGEPPIYMGNFITHGECNSCHGNSTLPIYVGQESPQNVNRVSEHGLTLSHTDARSGQDCMSCHAGYTIAGTVYDLGLESFYPDATLNFYTEPNGGGRLVDTLEVDGNGNFYTTDNINFGTGLYPVIESSDGNDLQYMPASTLNGACNSCHGVSEIPIYSGEKVNKLVSQHGTTTSHTDDRRGRNCMDCHTDGTGNPYIYTLAGTVYQQGDPTQVYPNATVYLYDQPNGKGNLVSTIEVDNNGNFFTTEAIDFGAGLYPAIVGNANNDPVYMPASTITGQCNSCHTGDTGTPRITVAGNVDQRVSAHGTSFSHTDGRRGANCLGCHGSDGDNPYQYSVAGTVYGIDLQSYYPNATITLYTGPDGTGDEIATIEVDGNGNFYTTESIDLGNGNGNGVYSAITGSDAESPTLYMDQPSNEGGCSQSSCHGVNRPPIYAQ
ncbi:MAG: hypothetical protein PVJ39_07175 [Gammaproteobacteria bacterium]|jgi:hypothetical protein